MIRRRAMVVGMLAAMTAGPAVAQRGAPPRQDPSWLRIDDWSGDVFAKSRYRSDSKELVGGRKITETDWMYETGLNLFSRGSMYHPNLMEWSAGAEVGYSDQTISADGDDKHSNGVLYGYNFDALLFKEKDVSGRVYADQTKDTVDRSFARAVDLDRQRQGFEVRTRGDLPMLFQYEHLSEHQDTGSVIDDQDGHRFRYEIEDLRDKDFYNRLSLEYETIEQQNQFVNADGTLSPPDDLSNDRLELSATNLWKFGPLSRHQLAGSARLMRREGAFQEDVATVHQRLDYAHSESFSSFYSGLFNLDNTEDQTDQGGEVQAGVIKHVYDSLDLTGWGVARYREFDDGTEQSAGVHGEAEYRKETPVGRLSASLDLGREYLSNESPTGQRRVVGESVTLDGVTPTQLRNPNVVAGTIVVTNADRSRIYVEGVDYLVSTLGDFTEIRRTIGGDITDGQTVLVDYTADVARDAVYTADNLRVRVRMDFDAAPVSVYTQYRLYDEQLISGNDLGTLDRNGSLLGGVEYRPLEGLRLIGEVETQDHRLTPPWWAYRARAFYDRALDPDTSLTLGAEYESLQYESAAEFGLTGDEDHQLTIGAFGRVTRKLTRWALLRGEVDYIDASGRNNDMAVRVGAGLDIRLRQLTISVEGYHRIYEQEGMNGSGDYVSVMLRRKF